MESVAATWPHEGVHVQRAADPTSDRQRLRVGSEGEVPSPRRAPPRSVVVHRACDRGRYRTLAAVGSMIVQPFTRAVFDRCAAPLNPLAVRAPAWLFASPTSSAGAPAAPPPPPLPGCATSCSRGCCGCVPSPHRRAWSCVPPSGQAWPLAPPVVRRGPFARIIERSTTLRSSRTLPGQGYCSSACMFCCGIVSIRLPSAFDMSTTNRHTRSGMSSTRSRSGGMWMGNTFSR